MADLTWKSKHNILNLDDDAYPQARFGPADREEIETTHEQRTSLFRKWKQAQQPGDTSRGKQTWLEFCATVQPTFGMDGAVCVEWCGMWLAIEKDGYTHS